MNLKIEYVHPYYVAPEAFYNNAVPVVRLAAVDQVIAEAVWAMEQAVSAMECGVAWRDLMDDVNYQRAQAFLASDTVAQWRKRQEKPS